MRGARGSDAGASADGSAAGADASPERLEASDGFGREKRASGNESEDLWGGASSSGGSSSEGSDGSEDGSEDADARRARDSRTPTPTRDPPRDARRHVKFREPDTTASETDRGPNAGVRRTEGQPRSFWDSVVSDGFASLGCGPLMGAGMEEDDSPRRTGGRRPRRRERGGVRSGPNNSDRDVTDDDVMLDLLGGGPSRAARRALHGDDAVELAGYYDGDDAAYESELERRRALRKSLRDGTPPPEGAMFESPFNGKRDDDSFADRPTMRTTHTPGPVIGADGVAFELSSLREAEDGEAFPSPAAVFHEFRSMIARVREDKNGDRARVQDKADAKFAKLEDVLANPSFLYKLHGFCRSPMFQLFIYICIAAVTVTSGLETSRALERDRALNAVGLSLSIVFALEAALKIVSAGKEVTTEDGLKHLLEPSPGRYFTDPMNVLDFAVVIFSFSDFMGIEGGSSLVVLRLLRLLRVLKVITVVPELQVILRGVGAGCRSIFWILLLLSGVVYVYSVMGVLIFRENDPRNFRDLGAGVGTVLNIVTGECVDYFFTNYYGCDRYGYEDDPERCVAPSAQKALACLYFVSLILIVGQIMMSLFIGVITNKMEQAAEILRETKADERRAAKAAKAKAGVFASRDAAAAALGAEDFEKVVATLDVISGKDSLDTDALEAAAARARDGTNTSAFKTCQTYVSRLVSNKFFEAFVVCVILVAGVETGVETSLGADEATPAAWKTVGEAVVWVFAAELALKMFVFADRPLAFFRGEAGAWNAFDLAVVVAAFVPSRIDSIAIALRLLRLLRILKLIRAVPQLQVIVTSLLRGTASIFYVALLMALVFYVYGIAGVHLYRENDPFHFNSLGVAFITLFRISMMDDWKVVVHVNAAGCATDFYGEDDGGDVYAAVTGSPGLCTNPEAFGFVAILYFGSFIIIGALVLVSVFVGIIVTGMQDATEDMNVELDRRRRARVSAEYFGIDQREVEAINRVFRVLDIDGGGELDLEEIKDAMRALGVPLHSKFLRQTVDVFADDKTQLDASDFLLLVSLCERAAKTQRNSGVTGKPFYGNSEDEREEGEALRGALRGLGSAGSRGSGRGSFGRKNEGGAAADGDGDGDGDGDAKNKRETSRDARRAADFSRRKIAVSDSTKKLSLHMDQKQAEARKVFGGMAGVFGRAKSTKK